MLNNKQLSSTAECVVSQLVGLRTSVPARNDLAFTSNHAIDKLLRCKGTVGDQTELFRLSLVLDQTCRLSDYPNARRHLKYLC